jgi:hypothetical protein
MAKRWVRVGVRSHAAEREEAVNAAIQKEEAAGEQVVDGKITSRPVGGRSGGEPSMAEHIALIILRPASDNH